MDSVYLGHGGFLLLTWLRFTLQFSQIWAPSADQFVRTIPYVILALAGRWRVGSQPSNHFL